MIPHKYGEFANMQIADIKQILRKRIFFLLVVAEKPEKFPEINLPLAHTTLMWKISGLNELLGEPTELVTVLSLLEEALNNLKTDFNFEKYRKLILDAGAEVLKIASPEYLVMD
jgi:hypothetical protein